MDPSNLLLSYDFQYQDLSLDVQDQAPSLLLDEEALDYVQRDVAAALRVQSAQHRDWHALSAFAEVIDLHTKAFT